MSSIKDVDMTGMTTEEIVETVSKHFMQKNLYLCCMCLKKGFECIGKCGLCYCRECALDIKTCKCGISFEEFEISMINRDSIIRDSTEKNFDPIIRGLKKRECMFHVDWDEYVKPKI